MPELPEVETVRKKLEQELKNKTIKNVKVYYPGIIAYPSKEDFIKNIKNKTINSVSRLGKYLIFNLSDYYLLSHLRMEGKYFFKKSNDPLNKHEHVVFTLDDNTELRYMDTRKFGKMYLINKDDINKVGPLVNLGLEPFDKNLTINYLKDKLKNKSIPIKSSLLDQNIISGIGNIYADEILYASKINPNKKSNKLNDQELENIIKNSIEILNNAILKGGTTIHSYTSVDGITGRFQQFLKVHCQNVCPNCQNKITKIKINGRGTYYCEICQK